MLLRHLIEDELLPKWAYCDAEYAELMRTTVVVKDGKRYVYDNARYLKEKANPIMAKLGMI